MRFDLVLATVDRTEELRSFLESLSQQTYRDFRLFVVDQNDDDRVPALFASLELGFEPTLLRSARGLSRARNAALPELQGDVVAFPDDDCRYPPDLLMRVARFLRNTGADGIAGRPVDASGRTSSGRWRDESCLIDRWNVWHCAISFTIFLRREVVDAVGMFDETFGPGAVTGRWSADETDYLLRALRHGLTLRYEPSLTVYHGEPTLGGDGAARGLRYGAGAGAVLRKHRYPFWFAALFIVRPLGGAVLAAVHGQGRKAAFHVNGFRGRLSGWLGLR